MNKGKTKLYLEAPLHGKPHSDRDKEEIFLSLEAGMRDPVLDSLFPSSWMRKIKY